MQWINLCAKLVFEDTWTATPICVQIPCASIHTICVMFVTCYSEYYLTRWQPTKNWLHRPLSLQDKVYQSPRLLFFSIAKRPLSFFGFSEQCISISFLVSHIIVKHHLYASFLEAHCSCILRKMRLFL